MKQIISKTICIAMAAASLLACKKQGGEEIVGDITKLTDLEFANCDAIYYEDEDFGNYYLTCYNGTTDEEGYFQGDAEVLVLDIYASKSTGALFLPVGTYKVVSESRIAKGTCLEGSELTMEEYLKMYEDMGFEIDYSEFTKEELAGGSGQIVGSEVYFQTYAGKDDSGEDDYEYDDFLFTEESGTSVRISKSGTTYTITVNAVVAGKDFIFTYKGAIDVQDGREEEGGEGGEGGGDVPSDRSQYQVYDFAGYTQGELDYNGVYDGVTSWTIYLGDNNINLETLEGNGKLLILDFETTKTGKTDIPAGKYLYETGDYALVGYYEYNDYAFGTMFYDGDDLLLGATDGNVSVSKSGSNYSFGVELYDDDYGTAYKANISLPLKYVDYSTSSVAQMPMSSRRAIVGGKNAKAAKPARKLAAAPAPALRRSIRK